MFPADTKRHLKMSYTNIADRQVQIQLSRYKMSLEIFSALTLQIQHSEVSVLKCTFPPDGLSLVSLASQDLISRCNSAVQHRSVRHCCQQIL